MLANGVISFTPCGCLQMNFCKCAYERAPFLRCQPDDSEYSSFDVDWTSGDEKSVGESEFLRITEEEYATLDEPGTKSTPLELSSDSKHWVDSSVGSCDS